MISNSVPFWKRISLTGSLQVRAGAGRGLPGTGMRGSLRGGVAGILGYKNHSPVSKRLARIRQKAAEYFGEP